MWTVCGVAIRRRPDDCQNSRSEHGSSTLWLIGLTGILVLAAAVASALFAAVIGRHQVNSAADLAALAGAVQSTADEESKACSTVADIARRNGSRLLSCRHDNGEINVTVGKTISLPIIGSRSVIATARAGPVQSTVDNQRLGPFEGGESGGGFVPRSGFP